MRPNFVVNFAENKMASGSGSQSKTAQKTWELTNSVMEVSFRNRHEIKTLNAYLSKSKKHVNIKKKNIGLLIC